MGRRERKRACGRSLALLVSLSVAVPVHRPACAAEVVLHRDRYASSGGQSFKNLVRDARGTLYCVSVREADEGRRELIVQRSTDGGAAWEDATFVLNDESSGLVPPDATNSSAVAIDDRGVLHVTWGNYYYPSSYHQLYRNWDPATGAASEIFDISAWTGAARTSRTAAMDIAVDQDGIVWIVAHGPQSWVERLARSAAPYAEGLEFVDLGAISPSASAQTTRIAIDDRGRVHCSFYRNTGAGQYEHRIFDPETGWGPSTNLGNVAAPNDIWGVLASDALGHVHVLFIQDGTDTSPLWRFLYRRWDEEAGWGSPVTLMDVPPEGRTGIADTHVISLGCDESTGEVTVLYRDLVRGGALGIVRKALDEEAFGEFIEVAPATSASHAYHGPSIRGRLYPEFDRTAHGLHATWQYRAQSGSPPYDLVFAALGGSEPLPPKFRRADADGDGKLNISDAIFTLSALFLGGAGPECLDAADSNDDGLLNLTDGVYTLNALFLGGPMPPPPGAEACGADPTTDDLGCERYASC